MTENIEKKEAFGRKLTDILNAGALNLAMGIGYEKRLFDFMDELGRFAAVDEIAETAGLNARYVREWLGVMVTGRIVDISWEEGKEPMYHLPREHACFLTRRAGNSNMGVYTQEIPMLTQCALEEVRRGFVTGDGVPFSFYPRFQAFMAELSNAKHRQILVDLFLPWVDEGRILELLETGIRVCDLGCGQGVALCLMAKRFPRSRFTGIDNHEGAIDAAGRSASDLGLTNLEFLVQDAAEIKDMPELENRFDYITAFDAIHDQTHPLEALQGVRHMLAPGGCFSMVDIDAASHHGGNLDHPMGPFLYAVSLMHCMPVGLTDQGTGLGMMWGRERAVELLEKAGFPQVRVQEMEHDPFNIHYFCTV